MRLQSQRQAPVSVDDIRSQTAASEPLLQTSRLVAVMSQQHCIKSRLRRSRGDKVSGLWRDQTALFETRGSLGNFRKNA